MIWPMSPAENLKLKRASTARCRRRTKSSPPDGPSHFGLYRTSNVRMVVVPHEGENEIRYRLMVVNFLPECLIFSLQLVHLAFESIPKCFLCRKLLFQARHLVSKTVAACLPSLLPDTTRVATHLKNRGLTVVAAAIARLVISASRRRYAGGRGHPSCR
jgi:hypothetical protein